MNTQKAIALLSYLVVCSSLLLAPAPSKGQATPGTDIVDTALAAGNFETLVAAVKAAGLVEMLKGPGPFTVFAPTDEAFAALPEGTVEDLLRPENRDQLATILKYHVVAGQIALGGRQPETLQGGALDIQATGTFRVDQANVLLPNIRATNGLVHVIDSLLMPEMRETTAVRRAMGVIELAIQHGVPLFNSGKPQACATVRVAIRRVPARTQRIPVQVRRRPG